MTPAEDTVRADVADATRADETARADVAARTQAEDTAIPGCKLVPAAFHIDERGSFVKPFRADEFAALGLATDYREQFFSTSRRDVLRGLHFQAPPAAHAKLVTCLRGRVLDVAVDLRRGSPTFGAHIAVELDGDDPTALYLPEGLAHGFLARSDDTLVSYLVTTPHSPAHDLGIRWDSAGIDWPCRDPLVSGRDAAHPALDDFDSPFAYEPEPAPEPAR